MAEAETLETIQPDPAQDVASYPDAAGTLMAADHMFKVWDGGWCGDYRGQLPSFTAALDTVGAPAERIDHYLVEKANDGSKVGPLVEGYDIELTPTVVVERDDEEVARFVEEEDVPITIYPADELSN